VGHLTVHIVLFINKVKLYFRLRM